MPASHQQLRLIVEQLDAAQRWTGAINVANDGSVTRIAQRSDHAGLEVIDEAQHNKQSIALQPLPGHSLRLALWSGHRRVWINSQPAPALATISGGDEIELDGLDSVRMHVAVYQPSTVAPAGDEFAGRECAACLGKIGAEQQICRCACGTAFHAEAELNCVEMIGECPGCRRAIACSTDGYVVAPEGYDGH